MNKQNLDASVDSDSFDVDVACSYLFSVAFRNSDYSDSANSDLVAFGDLHLDSIAFADLDLVTLAFIFG